MCENLLLFKSDFTIIINDFFQQYEKILKPTVNFLVNWLSISLWD